MPERGFLGKFERRLLAGVRDFDAKRLRGVCQAHVIAVESPEIFPEAEGTRQVKGVERAELDRVQVGGHVEDPAIERQECDRAQRDAGASPSQVAVAPRGASSLHDQ